MRKFESLIGAAFGLLFGALAFLAVFVLGAVVYKGPAPGPAVYMVETEATAAPVASDTAGTAPTADTPSADGTTPPTGIDLAAGEKAFKACKACHSIDKGAKNGTGPNLWGVFGRPAATHEGFAFSDALKALGGAPWDAAALDAFLTSPKTYAKGTKMAFAGVKKPEDRANLVAWLGTQSDTPVVVEAVTQTTTVAAVEAPAAPTELYADLADVAVIDIVPIAYPEGVAYADAPALTDAEMALLAEKVAVLEAEIPTLDYQRARYHPIHFQPAIAAASSAECLTCHKEILNHSPRETSPAGVKAADSLAWYQTLDTYAGAQADFHWRHMESDYAKQVMKLECTFCHKGNDPREESPDLMPGREVFAAGSVPEFTLRKMVNPSETCLMCHGSYPATVMGLEGKWQDLKVDLETAEAPNGCLSCHAETFRTNRHQVNYLNAATIEDIARNGTSDSCFGCHGGRQWYRISYPYARHAWPGMDTTTMPDWAVKRPTASKPEHQLPQP